MTAERRGDIEVVGVVDTSPRPPQPLVAANLQLLTATAIKRLFGAGRRGFCNQHMLRDIRGVARHRGVATVVPPARDVNDPGHIADVRQRFRADLAISLGCLQIFGDELLSSLEAGLNYHNGSLPGYRGLNATAWSIYNRESETGYCFHRMERGIDTGPILATGVVMVDPRASAMEMEFRKTVAAAQVLQTALELLIEGAPGTEQTAGGRYYSRAAAERIRRLDAGSRVTHDELTRRLEAFDMLLVTIDGTDFPVTELRPVVGGEPRRRRPTLTTIDGVTLAVTRCLYMPTRLFRVLNRTGLIGSDLWAGTN
jgi:methionyl-tRNA formyltransferase